MKKMPGKNDGESKISSSPTLVGSSSSSSITITSTTTITHHHHQHHQHRQPPNRTIPQLFGLFAVSFSYALMFATMSNIVIAKEVDRLASTSQTTWVGVIMAVGALAQLITPVVGAWSDRTGSREPFLKAGTIFVVMGIAVLYFANMIGSMIVLFVSQLVISGGLSIQYAMITVTLHDHVSDEQVGVGSSAMASLGILGAGCGYALFAIGLPLNLVLGVYALTTIICFFLTLSFMASTAAASSSSNNNNNNKQEMSPMNSISSDGILNLDENANENDGDVATPTPSPTLSRKNSSSSSSSCSPLGNGPVAKFCELLVHALTVPSPFTFPDFALALTSRGLFNAGLACQGYLVFFFRDVAKIGTLPPEQVVSRLAVLALLGGLVGAVPAGYLSDRWGKKPVIFVASFVCMTSILSFPYLTTRTHFDLIGLLFGFGNVSFLSVDYALGVQSLPRKTGPDGSRKPIDAAKDLGVFALSATIGMLMGQLIFAGILEKYSVIEPVGKNGAPESRYASNGFVLTFIVASVFFGLSALAAGAIKQLK